MVQYERVENVYESRTYLDITLDSSFFTGLLVHVNLFHLMINAISVYYAVDFLKGQVDTIKLLIFSAVAGAIANMVFSVIYRESTSVGGSPVAFAMLGLLLILQLLDKNVENFG